MDIKFSIASENNDVFALEVVEKINKNQLYIKHNDADIGLVKDAILNQSTNAIELICDITDNHVLKTIHDKLKMNLSIRGYEEDISYFSVSPMVQNENNK